MFISKKALAFSLFLLAAQAVVAQDEPTPAARKDDYTIVTDRPSISYASSTVPKGVFQFEFGYQYARNNFRGNFGDDSYSALTNMPNAVFRTGITDRWELHIGWDLLKSKTVFSGVTLNDEIFSNALTVGSRVAIIDKADGWRPEMTFFGGVQLPFTTSQPDGAINSFFRFCMQHNLSSKVTLFYNLGADFFEDSNGANTYLQMNSAYTLGSNYAINDHWNFYAEIYGFLPYRNFEHTFGLNGGFVYLLNKQVQFDAVGGFTINENNFTPFFMVGFSAYLKTK
jgi:hypothetical protein